MSKSYAYNEKLKYARELRGWSQEELARRIGCLAESKGRLGVVLDVSTISRWERGRNSPSAFYRQLLCALFEMNAEELGLLGSDNQNQMSEKTDALQGLNPVESIFFVRRREVLVTLLASTIVGGGVAAAIELFPLVTRFAAQNSSTALAGPSRRWPKVTPDIHRRLARVRVIQWMLNAHGWHLHVDGIFWVQTENAMLFFQENTNIPVTASVNDQTWEKLILPSKTMDKQVMYEGSQIKALQEMLNLYHTTPRLRVDGSFGPLTEAATRDFQRSRRLPMTGQADLNTWCVLVGGELR